MTANMWTVVASLADSILLRTLGLIAALVIVATGIVLGLRRLARLIDAEVGRMVEAALNEDEWVDDWWLMPTVFTETPIHDHLSRIHDHLSRERFEAEALAEIEGMTGGAA